MERALDTRCSTTLTLEAVAAVLVEEPGEALGAVPEADVPPGLFVIELAARLGEAQTVRQPVVVALSPPEVGPDEVRWPIAWHPASHERLLPELTGALVARRTAEGTDVALEGRYRPPLGRIGKFGDGVVGHRVARWTTATFLADLTARIAAVSQRRAGTSPHLSAAT
jgi:hypothetical protein